MIQDQVKIELPKGFYNIAITESNCLIADTNDTSNWDSLSIPLPGGEWKISEQKEKIVTLVRKNSPKDNPLKIPINHDMLHYLVTLRDKDENEERVIVETPDRDSIQHILSNSSWYKNVWGRYRIYNFLNVQYINRYGGSGSVYHQELVKSYIKGKKEKGESFL